VRPLLLVAAALLSLAAPARADFAVITQDASVQEEPRPSSRVLASLHEGDVVELVSRRSLHGYYQVRFGDDEDEVGYLYRRFFRARVGEPAPATPRPRGGGIEADGSFNGCPITGNVSPHAPDHDELVELNREKNRNALPKPADIDSSITLSIILQRGDDRHRFSATQAVQITGYVFDVKVGGIETSNCKARAQADRDTHIELVLDPGDTGPTRRVIVEVTPRIRELVASQGLDWSTSALQRDIVGRTVTVTGWLLFDAEHLNQAENTAPGNPSNWRATSWEVHPVTAMRIGPQHIAIR
jgi:hypothetical protein